MLKMVEQQRKLSTHNRLLVGYAYPTDVLFGTTFSFTSNYTFILAQVVHFG